MCFPPLMFCKDSDVKVQLQDVEAAVLPHRHNQKSAQMKLLTSCVTQYSVAIPIGQYLPLELPPSKRDRLLRGTSVILQCPQSLCSTHSCCPLQHKRVGKVPNWP